MSSPFMDPGGSAAGLARPCPVCPTAPPVSPGRCALLLLGGAALRPGRIRGALRVLVLAAPLAIMSRPQGGDLRLEISERLEAPVDRGETQVGDLVKLAKRPEDRQADLM